MPWGPTPPSSSGGSDASIVTPRVLHVTTAGDDSTGDGTLSSPFASVDVALGAGAALSVPFSVDLGAKTGDWVSDYALANSWPTAVTLRGQGAASTALLINTVNNVVIRSIKGSIKISVSGVGAAPSPWSAPADPGVEGGAGALGQTGPSITLTDAVCGNVESTGGIGQDGQQGGSYATEEGNGFAGGAGGAGGVGGLIRLVNCDASVVLSMGGTGGAGGAGGAGDPGAETSPGTTGGAGNEGERGDVEMINCNVQTVQCDTLKWARCNVEASIALDDSSFDYGGNSNMPHPPEHIP